jgi:HK97 family phage portal protein
VRHRDFAARREPIFSAPRNATTVASGDPRVLEFFGAGATASGQVVTEASAMRVATAAACTRVISGAIGSLPIDVYRREGTTRAKINEGDDVWWLLNERPHPRWTAANMWKWAVKSELLRGDGFIWIQRSRSGQVTGLKPLAAGVVSVELRSDRLVYFFQDESGAARGVDQDDMIHIPGFGFDGQRGMSVIQWAARNGIGIAQATDEFSGRFFSNGAMVKHVLKAPGKMAPEAIDQLRQRFEERYAGLDNAYRPMVLTEGLDVKELSLSAEDSQLLEARKFQVIDICRAFGVPPFMVGETEKTSSWGSGIEHMSLGFVKYTLADRLVTIEQELNAKLFRTSGRFVKFNVDELLRGDAATRAKFLRELVGGSQGPGIITADEARLSEGYPALGGPAAELFVPTNAPKGAPNAP